MNDKPWLVDVSAMTHHQLVAYYLMSSYLYYKLDENVISDETFDAIGRRLKAEWHSIEHQHKHVIGEDFLTSEHFSGAFISKYPAMVKGGAVAWLAASRRP